MNSDKDLFVKPLRCYSAPPVLSSTIKTSWVAQMRYTALLFLSGVPSFVAVAYANEPSSQQAVALSAAMPSDRAAEQVKAFKAAVRSGSCEQVSRFTQFPIRLNRGGRMEWLDKKHFCKLFTVLFDETRSNIVANQSLDTMPAGYRGLMFGEGIFWLQPVCSSLETQKACSETQLNLRLTAANL